MTLHDIITAVESREKTLTVFNPGADETFVDELREYFRLQNVDVCAAETRTGRPSEFAVLSEGDEFLTAVPTDDLRTLLRGTPRGDGELGVDDSAHHEFLQYLKETTFTSYSTDEMKAVSREIEDRAWRNESGALHAGFQTVSTMVAERDTYETLATTDLDVHLYARPDGDPPVLENLTVHLDDADEIRRTWFVVYDGDGDDLAKSALLAEERGDREFYGFWTYNPDVVDSVVEYLTERYRSAVA